LFTGNGGRVQLFGNKLHEPKFYSGRNYEQIEVRECMLAFAAELYAFQLAIHKYKYLDLHNCNLA